MPFFDCLRLTEKCASSLFQGPLHAFHVDILRDSSLLHPLIVSELRKHACLALFHTVHAFRVDLSCVPLDKSLKGMFEYACRI